MGPISKMIKTATARIGLLMASLILFSGGSSLLDPPASLGIQPASANTQYGILGQQAPELELNNWIDENGKPMNPIKLRDYRGQVIYLYFFQDW